MLSYVGLNISIDCWFVCDKGIFVIVMEFEAKYLWNVYFLLIFRCVLSHFKKKLYLIVIDSPFTFNFSKKKNLSSIIPRKGVYK